jgi:hypothetical protein
VSTEQPQKFGLKVLPLVMLGLGRDVLLHGYFLRLAYSN